MAVMAKERKQPASDRHKKKPFSLRLHPLLRQQLDKLVDQNASDLTEEISVAIRERLRQHGLWPPSSKG